MEKRDFFNDFPDWQGQELIRDGKLLGDFQERLHNIVMALLQKHETEYSGAKIEWSDYTVYTGTTGVALMYLHLHRSFNRGQGDKYLKKALTFLEPALSDLKHKKCSFIGGDAGPLAVAAVVYDKLRRTEDSNECVRRLINDAYRICMHSDVSDELLFGRVGFLYSILFIRKYLGEHVVEDGILKKVYDRIVKSGQQFARHDRSPCPLMYEWHEKKYFGAAHGLAGILYLLMQLKVPESPGTIEEHIRTTIDYLQSLRFPSGNYPSSSENNVDKLVHWCHGAPGWIHMFIQAYKVHGDQKYLEEARSCADVIWRRGLLRKGYGLCHGVAGNAYCFLSLYNLTKEQKYLYRAMKFAEWCFDYGKHGCRIADRPYSLFEGLAGVICFLADMLEPHAARFPAFEL